MTDENTHPQPAPPDLRQRLDEMYVIYGAAHAALSKLGVATMDGETVLELDERIQRLGLGSRPKVEDAEVEKYAAALRDVSGKMECEAADLLERLAGEADRWETVYVEICSAIIHAGIPAFDTATNGIKKLATKLAEREAELAQLRPLIAVAYDALPYPERLAELDGGAPCRTYEGGLLLLRDTLERHAARQQQKTSAETTESKAGETR